MLTAAIADKRTKAVLSILLLLLCVLIPFDKIMPGITFKWFSLCARMPIPILLLDPTSRHSVGDSYAIKLYLFWATAIDCCAKQ